MNESLESLSSHVTLALTSHPHTYEVIHAKYMEPCSRPLLSTISCITTQPSGKPTQNHRQHIQCADMNRIAFFFFNGINKKTHTRTHPPELKTTYPMCQHEKDHLSKIKTKHTRTQLQTTGPLSSHTQAGPSELLKKKRKKGA